MSTEEQVVGIDNLFDDPLPEILIPVNESENDESSDAPVEEVSSDSSSKEVSDPVDTDKKTNAGVSWATPLGLAPTSGVTISEFGEQEYAYRRVFIDGESTTYHVCCCRLKGEDKWNVLSRGLLSDQYVVASLEEYFKTIKGKIEIVGEPKIFSKDPWVLSMWLDTKVVDLNVFDSEEAKTIFAIFAGSGIEALDSLDTRLKIQCTNCYDGTRSLHRDFILSFVASVDGKELEFNDLFTLFDLSHRIEHVGSISDGDPLEDITDKIKAQVTKLKSYTEVNEIQEAVAKMLPKEPRALFNTMWGGIVGGFNNLYHMLILASIAFGQHYNARQHSILRSRISALIKKKLLDAEADS